MSFLKNYVVVYTYNNVGVIVDQSKINEHTLRRMFYEEDIIKEYPPLIIRKILPRNAIPWQSYFFLGWYDSTEKAISALNEYRSKH